MELTEFSKYPEAEKFNIIKIREYFVYQMQLISEIYCVIDRICKIVTDYFGGTIDDVYTDYNYDEKNPEITSNRVIELNEKMFICVDIYHPSIDEPMAVIELIPSYNEDENHESGDCSPNMVKIDIHGRDSVLIHDCLGTSDEFFKFIDDQDLLDKLDDLANHIKHEMEENNDG